MIKVISFDLDDTLSDSQFDNLIWKKEIPSAYAKEKNINLEDAKKVCFAEYLRLKNKIGGKWFDVDFWMSHFNLKTSWADIKDRLHKEIMHFQDSIPVLEELSKHFKLIIVSNAHRNFLDAKLELNHLKKFFVKTYSASSDFDKKAKDEEVFRKVLADFKITSQEIIHIGDDEEDDKKTPQKLGIRSFLVSRTGNENADFNDLISFKEKILKNKNMPS